MFKHILVGIDDSAASRRTVGAAVAIAQSLHAKLELVHAVDLSLIHISEPTRPY